MNNCLCGIPVVDPGELCPRCAALRVLGLHADSSENDIRAAYHVLVKVWHPDRFEGDKALKEAAEAKLKDVNSAYEFLSSTCAERSEGPRTKPGFRGAVQTQPLRTESTPERPPKVSATSIASPSPWIPFTFRNLFRFVLVVFLLLLCRYTWIAFDVQDSTTEQAAKLYGYGKERAANALDAPRRRVLEAMRGDLRRLGVQISEPPTFPQPKEMAQATQPPSRQSDPARAAGGPASQPVDKTQAAPRTIYSYITVGSTRNEVLELQGPPTSSSDEKLAYGRSELYFKDDAVTGWKIDPFTSPIRVKIWPETPVDPTLDSFTYGSSKDVVLVVQGTPTAFTEDRFEYGNSVVNFHNNRVVSWKSDPGSIPLRIR